MQKTERGRVLEEFCVSFTVVLLQHVLLPWAGTIILKSKHEVLKHYKNVIYPKNKSVGDPNYRIERYCDFGKILFKATRKKI